MPLLTSRAHVVAEAPERYAKQLVSHLGRRAQFHQDGGTATATISGTTARVIVGDGVVTLVAQGVDPEGVATVEQVLGGHLERFGARNELRVAWTRTETAADSPAG